jgi:RNA polymerase primary sigma factor
MAKKTEKIITHTSEIESYLRSVKNLKRLSAVEEKALLVEYQTASETRKQEITTVLANANQLYIFSVAKTYAHNDDSKVLDYVNEGTIGLMNAVPKFDISKKFRFITFAQWYIRQAMTNYAQTTDKFMRKSNSQKIGNKVLKIKAAFFQEWHRDPTLDEIKEELAKNGIKIKSDQDLDDVMQSSIDSVWGDESTFESNPRYIQHSAVDNEYEKEVEAEDNRSKVDSLLMSLDERSREVIKMLFGIGYDNPFDVEVVAERMGLTTTRIGQIKKAALKKLQQIAK